MPGSPHQREHLAHEVLGWPRGKGDGPTGLEHAQHLAQGHLRPGREHVSELADDRIEAGVRVGQGLDVALAEIDLDAGQRRMLPSVLDQHGGQVQRADLCAGARCRQRHDARAAGDIEHRLAGQDARMSYELRGGCRGAGLEWREQGPPFSLRGLEVGKWVIGHGKLLPQCGGSGHCGSVAAPWQGSDACCGAPSGLPLPEGVGCSA